jgi:hypothetical protein
MMLAVIAESFGFRDPEPRPADADAGADDQRESGADGWRDVLEPVLGHAARRLVARVFHADAACTIPACSERLDEVNDSCALISPPTRTCARRSCTG